VKRNKRWTLIRTEPFAGWRVFLSEESWAKNRHTPFNSKQINR
jgi:hypothetical protein